MLHDGVLHSAAWDDVWPEFCKHFHSIRYDRRGYGRSPAATEGYFETDDLAALLRQLKVARVAVVGSSHGGEISINFTLDHPEVVQQLILVGAVVGDADIPDVHAHAGAIEAGIPRARRIVLKDVGHLMYLEKPAEFSRIVIDFIEQNQQH